MVAIERDRIEIERLTNLTVGFGWNLAKQEFTDEKIIVVLEKNRAPGVEVSEAGEG